jgi:hypothetical protein
VSCPTAACHLSKPVSRLSATRGAGNVVDGCTLTNTVRVFRSTLTDVPVGGVGWFDVHRYAPVVAFHAVVWVVMTITMPSTTTGVAD